ncbi:hypothetical protein KGF56_000697 [Candida oxycetoniae]|uniref:WW domain-containing protein n=1 Tax=Candida oxycetoniae TaxID=497107 RepID=A0AAI9X047_9ASCO|nr:uncharacterized protein KGF56_000697 [Candida oxycetoniae]KAI3406565.1 hypothetical protein KGF56_000697 [Candida oxycetoniae]
MSLPYPWKLEFDPSLQQHYYTNMEDGTISFDSPCEVYHRKQKQQNLSTILGIKRRLSNNSNNNTNGAFKAANKNLTLLQRFKSCTRWKSNTSVKQNEAIKVQVKNIENSEEDSLNKSTSPIDTVDGTIQGVDEHYLLNNDKFNHFKNFAGTSIDDQREPRVEGQAHEENEELVSYNSEEEPEYEYEYAYNDYNDDVGETMQNQVRPFNYKYIYDSYGDYEGDDKSFDFNNSFQVYDFDKENERRELRLQMLKELY